jgi:hypothetical protein
MSTSQMRKRVEKVEEKVCPKHGRKYTLEEFCRLLWRQDQTRYMELVAEGNSAVCLFGSAQESDEVQAGVTFLSRPISVHSAVCETAT